MYFFDLLCPWINFYWQWKYQIICWRIWAYKRTILYLTNSNTGLRCFHYIMSSLGVSGNRSQAQPRISFTLLWKLTWVTAEAGYQSSEPDPHFKVFSAPYSSPAGASWHFSAFSLWGCNINKASLKVHQLLKLSRSLPITVTTQCAQHKNMFSLYNSQQTRQRASRWEAGILHTE